MSFDIIVLRPKKRFSSLGEITSETEVLPLGSQDEIRKTCEHVFSGMNWSPPRFGFFSGSDGYSIEFFIPEEQAPTSLHLCLHFGAGWKDDVQDRFATLLGGLYAHARWQAFAVSDGSSITPAEP